MRAPRKFLTRLRSLDSPFGREEVQALFPKLSHSTLSVYLSLAKRAGHIEQVGLGRYRNAKKRRKETLSPAVAALAARLRAELMPSALEQLVIWSDESLAPFVHNSFAKPFVVIEGKQEREDAAGGIGCLLFLVAALALGVWLFGADNVFDAVSFTVWFLGG